MGTIFFWKCLYHSSFSSFNFLATSRQRFGAKRSWSILGDFFS
ncbi:hypothetical protein AsAng_0010850 [Aureispira anguillae]|uniref:Uncharacterized protein n=1 Tax=Aureispira anguillae TaxID=2864201 RepID=A0A916DRG9_9BACT|nr:hypothetical protein AsAng_0010850 [Aureispira anguillae]